MRTINKEIGIYFFDELPENLKHKAIEENHDWNIDYEWYSLSIDEWKNRLEKMGFEDANIRFSGFWSQGDGASFTASCDHQKILNTLFMCNEQNIGDLKRWRLWFELVENGPYFRFGIRRNSHHYSHENTIEPYVEEDMSCFQHKIYEAFDDRGRKYYTSVFDRKASLLDLEEMFTDFVKDLCREIYSYLEQEYDYLTSAEAIAESLIANGVEFQVDMETMELI